MDDQATNFTLDTLASELQAQGKYDEAEPLYRELLEVSRETYGSRHPNTLASINNLGSLLEDKIPQRRADTPIERRGGRISYLHRRDLRGSNLRGRDCCGRPAAAASVRPRARGGA